MGRSFNYYVRQLAREARRAEAAKKHQLREAERKRKAKEREERAQIAELKRLAKESEKAKKELEKLQKQMYLESRLQEVEEKNLELSARIESYKNLLADTLHKDDAISFESLKPSKKFPPFDPPRELREPLVAPKEDDYFSALKPPTGLARLVPGAVRRYEDALNKARDRYQQAVEEYKLKEQSRLKRLEELRVEYDKKRQAFLEEVAAKHSEIDEFEKRYRSGEVEAVITYNSMVLERSEYPEEFPHQYRVAYVPESKELVVELDLPAPDVIPRELEFKYNKSKDSIDFKLRKDSEIKSLYQEIVSSLALRTIHEVLEADQENHIHVVTFNGFVDTVDLASGNSIRPCIISVRTTREEFLRINLSRVDKTACLRSLKAQISPQASEMIPVKPVVEFNMVDKRFIEQDNILAGLDSRPNLMDLRPAEFENLVSNLFQQMGLESKLTRTSRDGGVDVVAFDVRPVIGGKVVIQAKRYKNTVGVSAVRDLYGTMLNEGANKGILVTTSGYGTDAYEFAKDKPIELIDGGGLLYLLDQIGVKAKIVIPSV
ncbi:restriction endonuclease [Meiothermus sp.]|uniref:restriction endonuclease n=1 Tax=Meiothermus sp. TaxID=1955249 RepID=UPI0021DD4E82|nr:restriction endonuclease [Meiothermus sp.]GIW24033.1 MAG: restriction endonuclease [Meiothermus sp.]